MRTRFMWFVVMVGLLGTTWSPRAACQTQPSPDRMAALKARFDQVKTMFDGTPINHQMLMDGSRQLINAAFMFDKMSAAASSGKPLSRKALSNRAPIANPGVGVVSVNDNSTDLDFSSFDGMSQNTTSTAMCGNQVVVGYNDTGSLFQSLFFGTGGVITSGVAVSSDGGRTFSDLGFVNPGSDFNNTLLGDPVVTCSNSSTFFYTQIFSNVDFTIDPTGHGVVSIALSKSTDGGNTWADPQAAISKKGCAVKGFACFVIHFLDKPWMAIDPSNPQKMYITYTDFDTSNTSPGCGNQTRTAIEMVASFDGGQTFTKKPTIIDEQCGVGVGVQASHVAVNSRGAVYIAWERFTASGTTMGTTEVRVTHLNPDGSVAPSVMVDQKVMGGDTLIVKRNAQEGGVEGNATGASLETNLQGGFRDLMGLDLAVDHSGGPNDGTVYVTWDDARNKSVPDLAGFRISPITPSAIFQINQILPFFNLPKFDPNNFPGQVDLSFISRLPAIFTTGTYGYTDIRVSTSRDGVNFGPSAQVNSDRQPKVGGGHDHFQPAIATDSTGRAAICWYDRRKDPQNLLIERFCAGSRNGRDWDNFRVPIAPFAPIHRLDFALFLDSSTVFDQNNMGDYDGLTSDFTGKNKGFIGGFQSMSSGMNPDVKAYRFE
jgi:hypothetical protein